MVEAGVTVLLEMLASVIEAPAMLRDCLRYGSAAVFGPVGVSLWRGMSSSRDS